MRVLVTGGAGFLGSNLVRRVRATRPNWDVTVVDVGSPVGIPASLGPDVRFIQGDISHAGLADTLVKGVDAVVHVAQLGELEPPAGTTAYPTSTEYTWGCLESNIVGTYHVLEAARRYGRRLHHVSGCEVYGLRPVVPVTEESPLDPATPYAATRASADMLVRSWARSFGIPATVSRVSAVHGPYQPASDVVARTLRRLLSERAEPGSATPATATTPTAPTAPAAQAAPTVTGIRDWVHVDDHSDAVLAILESGRAGQTYLIGAGAPATTRQVADTLAELVGTRRSAPAETVVRPLVDAGKLRAELGWAPSYATLRDGLRATMEWFRDNESSWRTSE